MQFLLNLFFSPFTWQRGLHLFVSYFIFAINLEAEVFVIISNSSQTIDGGNSISYSATITNSGPSAVFLNGDRVNFLAPGTVLDDESFLFGAPQTLGPGQRWSGIIFYINIGKLTPFDSYSGIFELLGGSDASAANVIAKDTFSLILPAPTLDAQLSGLEISVGTLTPAFDGSTFNYTASVSNATTAITVTPIVGSSDNASVNGLPVVSGTSSDPILLHVGSNTIAVVVAGSDGSSPKTYYINVTRQSSIETWRERWFGTTNNTGLSADNADPFGTGVPNLAVFAFLGPNLDPSRASLGLLPVAHQTASDVSFNFNTPSGVSGVIYGAEWSPNLAPDSWKPISDKGVGGQHIFSIPIDGDTQRFLRLNVRNP